ncbi:hypothetical protein FJZ28_00585 [Candidatus Peregrinibacteria bacterium]|nr:hypothetical protein [Candidatus Peregrinibacteria bacterium]
MKKRNTLFLLQEEQPLFMALPPGIREGWTAEVIKPVYEDPRDLIIRFKRFLPANPVFKRLETAVMAGSGSVEDIITQSQELKMSDLSYEQMIDLFFVLGSKILGGYIRYGLKNVDSDDDLEAVMTLSMIRHSLFAANAKYPARA